MLTILIDTNFWLLPFEKGLDIFSQLDRLADTEPFVIGVPTPVLRELEAMALGPRSSKKMRASNAALRIIRQMLSDGRAKLLEYNGPADGSLITLALQHNAWVLTNDRALKRRLKEKKIKVVILRDGHKLEFG
jgi:rRNA-processing protein FCF1